MNNRLKVFLCHARADRTVVQHLFTRLVKDGVDAWFDKEKLLPGQDWEYEIRNAVSKSDVVVVCLSKQFNQAGFRQKEVRIALDAAMEKPEGEIFIIPARLEECDGPSSLKKWHWVDMFEDDGYEMLLRALRVRADRTGASLLKQNQKMQYNPPVIVQPAIKSALEIFEKKKFMRSSEVFEQGIQPRTLYQMRDDGLLVQEGRGLYRLADEQVWSDPDLALVSLRIRKGVICLISALYFHQLTTQIPHEVYVALPKDSEKPRISHPPTRFFWISPKPFKEGIEKHKIDNVDVKVYSVAKTIADCFKFRNKVGMDVALEALREGLRYKRCTPEQILRFARINRVEQVMIPYLEALT